MKRNILRKISIFSFQFSIIALLVSSCEKAPWTNGKTVTETRWFDGPVNAIHVYHDIDVTLIEADTFRIEVTTGENIMEKITSNVEDGILYLKNENIRNWIRSYDYPLEIKVYHNSITRINYESWGDLISEGYILNDTINHFYLVVKHGSGDIDIKLNCDTLNIKSHDGTAKISVAGSSDYTDIYHNARNNIYATELVSKDARARVYYEGSIYVKCTDSLEALVDDFGSIYYNSDVKSINATITETPVPNSRGVIEPYDILN
ncbi:MAG: DUF2807 domain-containing protein [Bacteroidales bacterium]|nr:DUF2807 domain-containing protein [Bacteroidales bacterium]